jgi:hypothetical protein
LAGTGIPEYSGDSGVIPDSGVQVKRGSRKKNPPEKTRIHRNPEESWTGTKNRDLEMIFLKQENATLQAQEISLIKFD